MKSDQPDLLRGEIFEDHAPLNVAELSRLCAVDAAYIVELVEEGVLTVVEMDVAEWRFAAAALRRTRLALRLQRDLEINLPGVALAVELMEQLEDLRRSMRMHY